MGSCGSLSWDIKETGPREEAGQVCCWGCTWAGGVWEHRGVGRARTHLWGTAPFSVTASHHMVKPTLTTVPAMKMRKTARAPTRRLSDA